MERTIRITPKDSEELAFLCELFDRLGLEYSVDEEATTGSNLVREPAEEEVNQGKGLTQTEARRQEIASNFKKVRDEEDVLKFTSSLSELKKM
jgi:hypothetical protein